MQHQAVISSNIASIGYENGVLEVAFKNGGVYQYLYVPTHLYNGLMSAASHGEYLDAHIKKGGFHYLKVR